MQAGHSVNHTRGDIVQKELPIRKHPRLKGYDYSSSGAYFITLCVKDKREMLGQIVGRDDLGTPRCRDNCNPTWLRKTFNISYMQLSKHGEIAERYLEGIEPHYKHKGVVVDKYTIMPNHVHIIIIINNNNGAPGSSRPASALIPNILAAFKKMTNKEFGFKMWQDSYHDHIIRNEVQYQKIWQYIDENPLKWHEDCYYTK